MVTLLCHHPQYITNWLAKFVRLFSGTGICKRTDKTQKGYYPFGDGAIC